MEMLQLRYFYESARQESFAKTAEKYMVPTTSVSASIKRLEKELGCQLFDRTSNRIRLNENGVRLQQSLCTVFSNLDGVVSELSGENGEEREIRILVRGMRRMITDMIVRYNAMYPQVRFKTVFDFREENLENYDIIVDQESESYAGYDQFEVYSQKIHFVCAAGDPLCGRRVTMEELSSRKFVSMGEDSNLHKVLLSVCARAGFVPDFSVLCNDIECYDRFVASGMGIALSTHTYGDQDGVSCLDVADFDERYTVCGFYKRAACTGRIRDFLEFVKEGVQGL